ncbi:MAG: hypothetical protein OEW48_14495, partial [Phycisphaerae bacterium]|nr:hypothetical protein [Phycisphaerae bacterium]
SDLYVDDDGPADFNTIQAAIDDSNDGDTIIVADGVYTGPGNRDIDFAGKGTTVRSENGPENCIIDCNGTESEPHRGFYFHNGESADSVIEGFTITNGYAPTEDIPPILDISVGGAIYNQRSSPTVTNCKFVGNSADYGGGMYNDNSNPIVIKCAFSENFASSGGGIFNVLSSPTVTNCTFRDNSASLGGGIYIGSLSYSSINYPSISNCVFTGNSAGYGGGMYIERGNPTVTNCTFSDNSAGENGGGIYISLPCFPAFSNCIFTGNSARYFGGGICSWFSGPCLTNCTFIANSAEREGGGLFHHIGSPTLANCIFRVNMDSGGTDESAQIYSLATPLLVNYSCIQGWTGSLGGAGNFDADPCFADPNNGDFHLKSQAGRWNPLTSDWILDDVTSLCIDAGDPASPIGDEPFPNGGITNMGAYGGTSEASKSYFGKPVCETIVAGDVNGDCKVNFLDFRIMAFHWLECTAPKCKRIIEVSAATDKSTYLLGEDVTIFVTAYNPNAEAVTLFFECMVASYLMDGVFDYAEVPWTPWPFHQVTIESHSSHTWELTHNEMGYPLGIGTHTVVGEVLGYGYSEPVDFEVIPE